MSEKAFFEELRKTSAEKAQSSTTGSPCDSSAPHRDAYRTGFSQAYEAKRYLPTFYQFRFALSARKVGEQQHACQELKASGASSTQLACCISGYASGERAFKEALKKSETIPAGCSDDFHRGARDAQTQCTAIDQGNHKTSCFVAKSYQCQAICYSYGWNEVLAPCLEKSQWVPSRSEATNNRSINFHSAYDPVKSDQKPTAPTAGKAGTAK